MTKTQLIVRSIVILCRYAAIDRAVFMMLLTGALLPIAAWLLGAVLWLGFVIWIWMGRSFNTTEALILIAITYGNGFAMAWVIRRIHKRSPVEQLFPLESTAPKQMVVRPYLQKRFRILRCLMARAIADSAEIRGALNTELREQGLWDFLEGSERDMAMAPGATLGAEVRCEVLAWSEQLRLLRWVLRIDPEIAPLWHLPMPEAGLLAEPKGDSELMRYSSELAPLRDEAVQMIEMVRKAAASRGCPQADEPFAVVFDRVMKQGRYSRPSNGDGERTLLEIASARLQYSNYLAAILEADQVISFAEFKLQQIEQGSADSDGEGK